MDHMTCPRPFQGQLVLRRLELAMINLHTKFEVSMFTHPYEDMKGNGNAKCRNSGVWGGVGLTEVTSNVTVQ